MHQLLSRRSAKCWVERKIPDRNNAYAEVKSGPQINYFIMPLARFFILTVHVRASIEFDE
jgi:hypothetical protein